MAQVLTCLFITLSLLIGPVAQTSQIPTDLYAAHYSPGLMEQVARNRNMEPVECMVSSPWYGLNVWIRVESKRNGEVAFCRTTDVSAPADKARHKRERLIELDWPSAKRLCAIKRVAQRSPRACPVHIEVVSEEAALAALIGGSTPAPPTP